MREKSLLARQTDNTEASQKKAPKQPKRARRLWRLLGAVLLTALLLLAAAAGAGWYYLSSVDWRQTIADAASQRTGRQVSIAGPLTPAFYPWLGVKAQGIRMAQSASWNANGTSYNAKGLSPFFTADSVKLRINLKTLLLEQVLILDKVLVERPVLRLGRNSQGEANWADLSSAAAGASSDTFAGGLETLSLRQWEGISITQGAVHWEDAVSGQTSEASGVMLDMGGGWSFDLSLSCSARLLDTDLEASFALQAGCAVDPETMTASLRRATLQAAAQHAGHELQAVFRGGADLQAALGGEALRLTTQSTAVDAQAELAGPDGPVAVSLQGMLSVDTAGPVSLADMQLSLPGLTLNGGLSGDAASLAEPRLDGDISVSVTDAALVPFAPASILGMLPGLHGSASLALQPGKAAVSGLQLQAVSTQLSGSAAYSWEGTPALSFDLAVPKLDWSAVAQTMGAAEATGKNTASLGAFLGALAAAPPAAVSGRLRCKEAVLPGSVVQGAVLQVTLDKAGFSFGVQAKDFAGGQASGELSGKRAGAKDNSENRYELSLKLVQADPAALLRAAGATPEYSHSSFLDTRCDLRITAAGQGQHQKKILESLRGSAQVKLGPGRVALPGEGDQRTVVEFESAVVDGAWRRAPGNAAKTAPFTASADVELALPSKKVSASLSGKAHVDLNTWDLAALTGGRLRASYHGLGLKQKKLDLRVQAKGGLDLDRERLELSEYLVHGLGIGLSGRLAAEDVFTGPAFSGTVKTSSFVPRDLFRKLDVELWTISNPKAFGQASLSAGLSGTMENWDLQALQARLDGLQLALDGVNFSGAVQLADMAGPRILFDLFVDNLDCDNYRNTEPTERGKADPKVEALAEKPADSPLGALYAKGRLQVGTFKLYNFRGDNVASDVRIEDNSVHVGPLHGGFYGGDLNGTLQVDVHPILALSTQAKATKFRMELLLSDLFDFDRIGGAADLDMTLNTRGWTYDGRILSLGGEANLDVTEGFHTFFGPKKTSEEETGKKDRTAFTQATAHVLAKDGVVTNDDLHMEGGMVRANGGGVLNLPDWAMEYDVNYNITGLPTIPVRITGSLDEPDVNVSLPSMLGRTIGRIGGSAVDIVTGVLGLPFRVLEEIGKQAKGEDGKQDKEEDESEE